MNTIQQPDSSVERLQKSLEAKSKVLKEPIKNFNKKSIKRLPVAKTQNENGILDEDSNDSVHILEKPSVVIEIDSSEDENLRENPRSRKRKSDDTGNDATRKKAKLLDKERNPEAHILLHNKPLTFGEFGFKFMEEESSNSNSRSYKTTTDEENLFELLEQEDEDGSQNQVPLNIKTNAKQRSRSNFTCQICNKEVVSRYNLKRHMMIHSDGK